MIRVAIVEDDEKDQKRLKESLEILGQELSIAFDVKCYGASIAFLSLLHGLRRLKRS
ncbi:MAG: hypothetical protein Q4F15_03780 [Bacillota bacterium]|nr:hypothetical protein [Bacillota bacterium]